MEKMITTVTLNPCIDLTVHVDSLKTGGLNLVGSTRTDISGKGINVSVVLRALGQSTMCTGISFDGNGQQLEDYLEGQTISRSFAMAHGNIRTNIKIYDDAKAEMTEINHRGCPVEPGVIADYLERLRECAAKSSIVVFSGRIPAGADDDILRRSIKAIRDLPVKVIVDAEGAPLKRALLQKPYLIKPNTYELETAFKCKVETKADIAAACRAIIAKGVEVVCVSMGGDGAMIVSAAEAYYAPALDIDVKGFTGAGDSMVAGICKAIKEDRGIDDMLRFGMAAAAGSLIREGTLLCRKPDFQRLLPQVTVEKLDIAPAAPTTKPKARKSK